MRTEDKACGNKVDHKTMKNAVKSAKFLTRRHHKKFEAYRCGYCNGFHVGHAKLKSQVLT